MLPDGVQIDGELHPLAGLAGEMICILLQDRQVLECIDIREFTGMDQAHKEIADARTTFGFEEETAFPMQNRSLQCALDNVMPTAGLCRVGIVHIPDSGG
jgi:hypothetical protein